MTMPPARGVLGVDEDECEDNDTGASILRGIQFRYGIVSHGWLPTVIGRGRRQECDRGRPTIASVPRRSGWPAEGRSLVPRQLCETALHEERHRVVVVVGVPERVIVLLQR
jgi:hypothetical protein